MERKTNSLNEELKKREQLEKESSGEREMTLDDTERVKVLSPGRLVIKRFLRNKLALTGLFILAFMFLFAFVGPLFYPYSQTQIFYTYKPLAVDYASATERTEAVSYVVNPDNRIPSNVKNLLNSNISKMEKAGQSEFRFAGNDGRPYEIQKLGEGVYTLSEMNSREIASYSDKAQVATYNRLSGELVFTGEDLGDAFRKSVADTVTGKNGTFKSGGKKYSFQSSVKNKYTIQSEDSSFSYSKGKPDPALEEAALAHLSGGTFELDGQEYLVSPADGNRYAVLEIGDPVTAFIASTFVFNSPETGKSFTDSFRIGALDALYTSKHFEADGMNYSVSENAKGTPVILDASGNTVAELTSFVVRRYSGQDTLAMDFKEKVQSVIEDMEAEHSTTSSFSYNLPEMNEQGEPVLDENGNVNTVETTLTVSRKNSGDYVIKCEQITYMIDIYASPSRNHWLGTDGDGMDILARTMYGGRISLLVGFVVVFMETILGVLLGGLAGFFGGWVDTLIMRLVDIFYCIPTYPILIIMGAFMDAMKLSPYTRLMWMMVILGVLGWAVVARLVRGQILSLREQEFMVAQEATGMRSSKRILKHLVPNVMPYLIVNATMGLGDVIITESTLSFLGLGVKHPLATWGTMINSVASSAESMVKYTYIWIPVGLLICLTVIAFNFVGDGLRDAFDPKSK